MDFEEALERIIDGDALMFAGAGCSKGAINLRKYNFRNGPELAGYLAQKSGIETDTPLEDAAQEYIDKYGEDALIREIQFEFTTHQITKYHKLLGALPWKRIYTTNYDDVLEVAYTANARKLVPITVNDDPYKIAQNETSCIHLNGFVHKLDRDTINKELKLTNVSYISSSIADSQWAYSFRQDIRYAQAIFFIGYSLYDLDIKRILFDSVGTAEKSFFVIGNASGGHTIRLVKRFGNVLPMTMEEFADAVAKKKHTYIAKKLQKTTISIKEHTPTTPTTKIKDRDFVDMILYGKRDEDKELESLRTGKRYLLERNARNHFFRLVDEGQRLIVVLSDLGNGKSLFLDGVRARALERGFRVFEVREHNEEAAAELQTLAKLSDKALVTIEEYQDWLTEIHQFKINAGSNITLLLTARSPVHDVVVDDLLRNLELESVPELRLDKLDEEEIEWFVGAFDEYGLWGVNASKERSEKIDYLKRTCRGEIHAILLKIVQSPDIGERLHLLTNMLRKNREQYEILLGICMLTILGQRPEFETAVDLWGTETLLKSTFRKDPVVKQFLNFEHDEIIVKSPVAAQFILQKVADPSFTVNVLSKMAIKAHTLSRVSERYRNMLNNLIRFGNISLLLPSTNQGGAVIKYYESIKNLAQCQNHPLFWLQYAIACLIIHDMFRSKRYFETAYSLASKRSFNTYQIDNHYARFLLTETTELPLKDAMTNFRNARTIINRQILDEKMSYPYRSAALYRLMIDHFEKELTLDNINEIRIATEHVSTRIANLPEQRRNNKYVRDCAQDMSYIIKQAEGLTIEKQNKANKTDSKGKAT